MNGWDRVPETRRARIQVENYLLRLRCPSHSFTTVLRLARTLELRGWRPDPDSDSTYELLREISWEAVDLNNSVLRELRRRAQHAQHPTPPTISFDDYVAGKPIHRQEATR